MSALSELLNSKAVTARQAAEKAEEMDIDLRYGTIAAYWSGGHGRPTANTLKKLAAVVPFTEKQLQQAAWNDSSPLGPWVPPQESILLDRRVRKALDNLIKAVVMAKGSSNALDDNQTQTAGTSDKASKPKEAWLRSDELKERPGEVINSIESPEESAMDRGHDGKDGHGLRRGEV